MKKLLTDTEVAILTDYFIETMRKGTDPEEAVRQVEIIENKLQENPIALFTPSDAVMRDGRVFVTNKIIIKRILRAMGQEMEDCELPNELEIHNNSI